MMNQGIHKWMHETHTPSRKERKHNYFEQPAPTFIFWRFMPCFVLLMMSSCDIQFKKLAWDTLATPHFYTESAMECTNCSWPVLQISPAAGAAWGSANSQLLHEVPTSTKTRTCCPCPCLTRNQKWQTLCKRWSTWFHDAEYAGWGAPQQQLPSGKTSENNAAATFQMMKPGVVR